MTRTLRLVGALLLGATLVACSSDSTSPAADSLTSEAGGSYTVPEVTLNGDADPTIATPTGTPPTSLVSKDLVVGDGAEATASSTVTVHYSGRSWSDGSTFDSSWLRGEPATFPLANLIPGWQVGIPGMKVGGTRLLIIPPDLGYGAQGGGSIKPNETLVFVIELKAVS